MNTMFGGRDLLHRYKDNPILSLEDMPFPCNTVFNGTTVKHNGEYLLLLRVEGQRGFSFFALARSADGYRFTVDKEPAMLPAESGPFAKYETRGIEDPRATFIDGAYHILYTAVSEFGYRIALARTEDFESFERVAMVSEPGNKDGVLFPEKIDGRYARLDRPLGLGIGRIWLSWSPDLENWGESEVVFSPRRGYWDSFRIGASVPPIRTKSGWLEIYHGMKMTSAGPIYRAGAALLDLKNPARLISRCDIPILSPREEYERVGDVGNVVFPCGAIVEPDGEIKIYYGAADTCIGVATARLEDLVSYDLNNNRT